jgi:hypothetical protein
LGSRSFDDQIFAPLNPLRVSPAAAVEYNASAPPMVAIISELSDIHASSAKYWTSAIQGHWRRSHNDEDTTHTAEAPSRRRTHPHPMLLMKYWIDQIHFSAHQLDDVE